MSAAGSEDEQWMRQAIRLAQRARATGDTPVGALVTRQGRVVAEGIEAVRSTMDPAAHAELLALREACRALRSFELSDCILVTTAEPCWMCSFAARQVRISRILIGRATPHIGGISSNYPILSARIANWGPPPEIVSGVLAAECAAL